MGRAKLPPAHFEMQSINRLQITDCKLQIADVDSPEIYNYISTKGFDPIVNSIDELDI